MSHAEATPLVDSTDTTPARSMSVSTCMDNGRQRRQIITVILIAIVIGRVELSHGHGQAPNVLGIEAVVLILTTRAGHRARQAHVGEHLCCD